MNNFYCRYPHLRVDIYRHSSAVVLYSYRIIFMDSNFNSSTESGKSFVYTIIYYFIYEMMKTSGTCTSDVHTGSFSYRFKTFKHLYLLGAILLKLFLFRHFLLSFFANTYTQYIVAQTAAEGNRKMQILQIFPLRRFVTVL